MYTKMIVFRFEYLKAMLLCSWEDRISWIEKVSNYKNIKKNVETDRNQRRLYKTKIERLIGVFVAE